MQAIIETGGKQYRVKEGDELFIEKLDAEAQDTITFDKVLAVFSDDKVEIGAPYLRGVKVNATVIKSGKAKKIIVYKMKPKKGYRRKQGHRQPYTKIQIEKIV
ncbi:MAG: 50S ribosomal protein L21 [Oscillospiraceae bacterium]|nr:50S ribosomal protein L21 [Oscillospiraceae bacterium]